MVFPFIGRGQDKKSAIDDQIERSCNDSTIQDFQHNKIYYFGGAVIKYEDIEINADYIAKRRKTNSSAQISALWYLLQNNTNTREFLSPI